MSAKSPFFQGAAMFNLVVSFRRRTWDVIARCCTDVPKIPPWQKIQLGLLFPIYYIYGRIKNVPNHQPVIQSVHQKGWSWPFNKAQYFHQKPFTETQTVSLACPESKEKNTQHLNFNHCRNLPKGSCQKHDFFGCPRDSQSKSALSKSAHVIPSYWFKGVSSSWIASFPIFSSSIIGPKVRTAGSRRMQAQVDPPHNFRLKIFIYIQHYNGWHTRLHTWSGTAKSKAKQSVSKSSMTRSYP